MRLSVFLIKLVFPIMWSSEIGGDHISVKFLSGNYRPFKEKNKELVEIGWNTCKFRAGKPIFIGVARVEGRNGESPR